MKNEEKMLTLSDVARRLNVSPMTVRNWYKAGKILLIRYPAGTLYMAESELQRILAGQPVAPRE